MTKAALSIVGFFVYGNAMMLDIPARHGSPSVIEDSPQGDDTMLVSVEGTHNRAVSCVVWHSQHKSAGATFEDVLSQVALNQSGLNRHEWGKHKNSKFICDKETWNCEQEKCVHNEQFEDFSGYKIALRGYVQVLAGSEEWGPARGGHCVWATMFRDPVARLVSAYMYCKKGPWPQDPLCGFDRLPPNKTSGLEEFAEHWGNYLFRELLWFPELHAFASTRPGFKQQKYCETLENGTSWAPESRIDLRDPWVAFKDQLNGGDSLRFTSGRQNFAKLQDYLFGRNGVTPLYDVIGVAEHFDESLKLFDDAMQLGFSLGWQREAKHQRQSHGSEEWKKEEMALLAEARNSTEILKLIDADIKIYEGVLERFNAQMEAYNAAHNVSTTSS